MELERHSYLEHAGTYDGAHWYTPSCWCDWTGTRTRWGVEAHAQYTAHVHTVADFEAAGRQLDMNEAAAQAAADNLARHAA